MPRSRVVGVWEKHGLSRAQATAMFYFCRYIGAALEIQGVTQRIVQYAENIAKARVNPS